VPKSDSSLAAVATFGRVMGDENMVTICVDIDVFGTELMPIILERNGLERFIARMEIVLHAFVSI